MKHYALKPVVFLLVLASLLMTGCRNRETDTGRETLFALLETPELTEESRFSLINQISQNMLNNGEYNQLILFLTNYVRKNPKDQYNPYWLLMTAYAYQQNGAETIAERYFERIIQNYDDLTVKGRSIHMICLQNLIQISTTPENRIEYFNRLIAQFPNDVNKTELLVRLAQEYETLGEWNQVLKSYSDFLLRNDAQEIQVAGIPDAYATARYIVDFNNSAKSWTFESLDALASAVKRCISNYDWRTLDTYKSQVNFFAMSWRQDETQENSLSSFTMRDFMVGRRIRYNKDLDDSSTPNEAYLRTWGWSDYVSVWYLYFRKVNFPLDPEIHGRWEWAGIYYGEKL